MKITPAYSAVALLATSSSGFTAPQPGSADKSSRKSMSTLSGGLPVANGMRPTMRAPTRLNVKGNGGDNLDDEDMSEYLGPQPRPQDGLAFADIINDDMASLTKRLEQGFNPDTRFFHGNTILHLIALKASEKSLDEDKYREVVSQIVKSGGDLKAANDMGFTALEFLENNKSDDLAEFVRRAQSAKVKTPVQQDRLDSQLATFSMQSNPSPNGKKWIVELVKSGADPEHVTSNGKTVSENIQNNWPEASAKAFTQLVVAAKFKSAANGGDKTLSNTYINDQWINAVMDFYKANAR